MIMSKIVKLETLSLSIRNNFCVTFFTFISSVKIWHRSKIEPDVEYRKSIIIINLITFYSNPKNSCYKIIHNTSRITKVYFLVNNQIN